MPGVVFGDGLRCVGGPAGSVVRIFPFAVADVAGTMSATIDSTLPAHSQLAAAMPHGFQAWFRDPAAGMSGFNLSNGLEITFAP